MHLTGGASIETFCKGLMKVHPLPFNLLRGENR